MMRELCALVAGEAAACPQERVPELLALARTHRVHLLVEPSLARPGPLPANQVCDALRVEARVEALRDALRVRELLRVTGALEAAGCAPVVFKGAALALTHYADSWRRPRLDADVLIDPAGPGRAAAALAALGYTRPPMTAGRYVMHQEMYVRPHGVVGEHVVDLHWKLANPNVLAALPAHDSLRGRSVRVAVEGCGVAVASPADALVIACVHRAAHHAASDELLWLYDVHLLASRLTPQEWDLAVRLAADASVSAVVRDGLARAAHAFGERAPAAVREALSNRGREPSALFLRRDLRPVDRLRADIAALGPVAGFRLVAEHLFPPAAYMRERYALRSRALLPLFYARRIAGGASAWLRKASALSLGAAPGPERQTAVAARSSHRR